MAEAAIALSYPEPYNQGRFLGLWLSFRVAGQILGGAVHLGLDADRSEAGSVSYSVYQVFIALQAAAPFAGLLLTAPSKVQRTDGRTVFCANARDQSSLEELMATGKLFLGKYFMLTLTLIAQAVFAESVFFTFEALWFSVRARALASFLSGIIAIIGGNILGAFLDHKAWPVHFRARWSFAIMMALQGDWVDAGFGRVFAWFLLQIMGFQINYMYLYFVMGNLAKNDAEIIRYASLLRGSESAVQAVSYSPDSIKTMGQIGCIYINFGLWAISILPAWMVLRWIGVVTEKVTDRNRARE